MNTTSSSRALDVPSTREGFLTELARLEAAFAKMQPLVELTVRDPALDCEGYVVVWNTLEPGGIAKGGTRVTPTVSLDEIKMLARTMALKNAAAGLPLGGAKSGVRADPWAHDIKARYQAITKRFACLFPVHGGALGGLGYDIGARPEFCEWFIEATEMPQRFTGKTRARGGTDYDVEGIAGLGVAVAAREALAHAGKSAQGARFAVQGLGAMGAGVVRYFAGFGGRLIALADPVVGGSWTLPDSLKDDAHEDLVARIAARDYANLRPILDRHGKLEKEPDAVLFTAADVLFPSARQDVISTRNADRIQARMLSEGANGPCSSDARERLHARGVTVLPDFLANPGGIIAAYVEMTSQSADKVAEAKAMTERVIAGNVRGVLDVAKSLDVAPAQAAMFLALRRVVGA
ncbi:MAG: Glu/Leu/Phe/Val dehydrogenase [Planctomycetes bacterium]|nr:Glu/Leu/Phe/Val dehydrogenase [Planctomycetota bacterium]